MIISSAILLRTLKQQRNVVFFPLYNFYFLSEDFFVLETSSMLGFWAGYCPGSQLAEKHLNKWVHSFSYCTSLTDGREKGQRKAVSAKCSRLSSSPGCLRLDSPEVVCVFLLPSYVRSPKSCSRCIAQQGSGACVPSGVTEKSGHRENPGRFP